MLVKGDPNMLRARLSQFQQSRPGVTKAPLGDFTVRCIGKSIFKFFRSYSYLSSAPQLSFKWISLIRELQTIDCPWLSMSKNELSHLTYHKSSPTFLYMRQFGVMRLQSIYTHVMWYWDIDAVTRHVCDNTCAEHVTLYNIVWMKE